MGAGIGSLMLSSMYVVSAPCSTLFSSNRELAFHSSDFYKLQPIAIIWFVGAILDDTIITIVMLYFLLSARTGLADGDNLIKSVCKAVVETGLSTTTVVILDAIFFFRFVRTFIIVNWLTRPLNLTLACSERNQPAHERCHVCRKGAEFSHLDQCILILLFTD